MFVGFFFLQILGNVSRVWRCCATADWSQSCSQHALQLVVVSQRSGKQSVMSTFHCSARMRPVSLHVSLDQPTVFNKKNSECHRTHPQVDFSFQSTSWQAAHPSLWCSRGWFYRMFTAVSSTLYCQRWDQDRVRFITQQVWLVNPGVRSESRGVCLIFSFKVLLFHIDMSAIDVKLKQSHLKKKNSKVQDWIHSVIWVTSGLMGINKIPSLSVALTRRLGGLGGLIGSQRLPASTDTLAPRSPTVLSSCESPLSSSTQHFESRLIVLAHTAGCCSHDVTVMCPSCHSVRREWKKFCCRSRRPFSQSGDRVCGLNSETLWHFKRWFVLWWAHVFTVSRSQQINAGQTVIRGFTHKQTQKWCRFTLFSTWTTNTLNLYVRTSSRARKHHSKFKSLVKL